MKLLTAPRGLVAPHDPYVRRFWVAALGAAAVTDLLRLIVAGRRQQSIRKPIWLPSLVAAGLAVATEGTIHVAERVPIVPGPLRRRFSPGLRCEHDLWLSRNGVVENR